MLLGGPKSETFPPLMGPRATYLGACLEMLCLHPAPVSHLDLHGDVGVPSLPASRAFGEGATYTAEYHTLGPKARKSWGFLWK